MFRTCFAWGLLAWFLFGTTLLLPAALPQLTAGAGGWSIRSQIDLSAQACQTVQGFDLDGDGHREMLTITTNNATNNLKLYEFSGNDADPTLVWQATTGGTDDASNLTNLRIIAIGDSDGDGRREIIAGCSDKTPTATNDIVKIYEFDPSLAGGQLDATNPPVTPTVTLPVGGIAPATDAGISGVLIADLDSDTHPEIIIATQAAGRALVIYENTANNTYATPVTLAMPAGVGDISRLATDLDGDGAREIALVAMNRQLNVINFNGTVANVEFTTGTASGSTAGNMLDVGDIDDNGRMEIVYADANTHSVKIIEGVATNTYTTDEPGGLWIDGDPLLTDDIATPPGTVGVVPFSASGTRNAVMWGCQTSGTDGQAGGHEDFYIAEHIGVPGDFRQSAFAPLQSFLNPPQEPVWISSFSSAGTLDGDNHVDLLLGTRSSNLAADGYAELFWVEYNPEISLNSGQALPVGDDSQLGPLAAPQIASYPVGCATVYGSAQPDLFVRTNTALYLYPWRETASSGAPVFGLPSAITSPALPLTVFQTADNAVHAMWLNGKTLVHGLYEHANKRFVQSQTAAMAFPRNPAQVAALLNPNSSLEVLVGMDDGVTSQPTDYTNRQAQFRPYDGAGVWRGGFPYTALYGVHFAGLLNGTAGAPTQLSATLKDVRHSFGGITQVNLGTGHQRDFITGSRYGDLHYYRNTSATGMALEAQRLVVGSDGIALRHPTINPTPLAYPDPVTGLSNLLVGGEGAISFYKFSGTFNAEQKPVYAAPVPTMLFLADLYGGSMAVANTIDWNGDGALDLISGNSEGRVLFFQNTGDNDIPAFLPGVALQAGGQPICIQPGYGRSIQGPPESRWGYACPTVVDWNNDDLPDMLMGDGASRQQVYLNKGTAVAPALAAAEPLFLDGLDLHGTWRVKPAVGPLAGRMAYITLDDQDQFHLYWKLDDTHLTDGGKLTLSDNSVVGANYLPAGGTGQLKLSLFDWDRDGLQDLLIGTSRYSSVPNTATGLPKSLASPSATVLFLRNINTDATPKFATPVQIAFKGTPLALGENACAPAVADFGTTAGPGLIVATETGRFIYYSRTDLTPGDAPPLTSIKEILNRGGDFDPWNEQRWAYWYTDGKITRVFNFDTDYVRFAARTTTWYPDLSGLTSGNLFQISSNPGIEIDGNGITIDARPAAYRSTSLDTLYAGGTTLHNLTLGPLERCFQFGQAKNASAPASVIHNFTMSGFEQAVRTSSSQYHPLIIRDCLFTRNSWGTYFSGTATTATLIQYLENGRGALYLGAGSDGNFLNNNTYRDNCYVQHTSWGDYAIDTSYNNIIENNQFLASLSSSTRYRRGLSFYHNFGEDDNLREDRPFNNIIRNNTFDGYTVAIDLGARMGQNGSYDLAGESRDHTDHNTFSNNIFKNCSIGVRAMTQFNIFDSNVFQNNTNDYVFHCVYYNVIGNTLRNQGSAKVAFWWVTSDYTAYASYFPSQNDLNGGIAKSAKLIQINTEGTAPTYPSPGTARFINAPTLIAGGDFGDTYSTGGTPRDIAVGDYYQNNPGDEVAVIWNEPVSNISSTDYNTIIFYGRDGVEVNRSGLGTTKWQAIAAGDFLSNQGEELAAVPVDPVGGYYPIYIFRRGHQNPHVTLLATNTTKITSLAGGNFKTTGDAYDEVAAVFESGSTNITYVKPTDTTWSATSTGVTSRLIDLAAGNFDGNTTNGDEVAGITATAGPASIYRSGVSGSVATAGGGNANPWGAIAAGNFDGSADSRDEIALANTVAISGRYPIEYFASGFNVAFKQSNQDVNSVPMKALAGGNLIIDATLSATERAIGFTSTNYGSTMAGWGEELVALPASATNAIPCLWLNTNPSNSAHQYLRTTPLVR